jgi:hypothetical protein
MDFGEKAASPDLLRMLIGGRARIGIKRRTMAQEKQGGIVNRRHIHIIHVLEAY